MPAGRVAEVSMHGDSTNSPNSPDTSIELSGSAGIQIGDNVHINFAHGYAPTPALPSSKTTYIVHAKRWKNGWELHIDGVGVTQCQNLNDAEAMVRDFITLDTGAKSESFDVEILPALMVDGLDEEITAARQAVISADTAQRAAARMSREVACKLKAAGLSGREIAVVLKLSPQRVSQLLRSSGRKVGVTTSKVLFAVMSEVSVILQNLERLSQSCRIRLLHRVPQRDARNRVTQRIT